MERIDTKIFVKASKIVRKVLKLFRDFVLQKLIGTEGDILD